MTFVCLILATMGIVGMAYLLVMWIFGKIWWME